MSHENHSWSVGSPPPEIRPHSIAKHRVLLQYLERYVTVLTSNKRIPEMRLTLGVCPDTSSDLEITEPIL